MFKVIGLDKLIKDSNGYSGVLTVKIPGIAGKRGFTYKVLVTAAPTMDAAKFRALKDVERFAIELIHQVKSELFQAES